MTLADDVRAIAELRRKATPGAWHNRPSEHGRQYRYVEWGKRDDGYGTATIAPAEAAFIAAAANLDWDVLAAALDLGAEGDTAKTLASLADDIASRQIESP